MRAERVVFGKAVPSAVSNLATADVDDDTGHPPTAVYDNGEWKPTASTPGLSRTAAASLSAHMAPRPPTGTIKPTVAATMDDVVEAAARDNSVDTQLAYAMLFAEMLPEKSTPIPRAVNDQVEKERLELLQRKRTRAYIVADMIKKCKNKDYIGEVTSCTCPESMRMPLCGVRPPPHSPLNRLHPSSNPSHAKNATAACFSRFLAQCSRSW